jgi:hypothetical protein
VLLPAAGQQKFLGLRIAVEAQALVLFEDLVDGVAHTVLVIARLGRDGVGDGRLRQIDRRIGDHRALVGQRVAGEGVLELGDAAQVAGVQLSHRLDSLAEQDPDMREALRRAGAGVHQVGVVL